MSNTAKLTVSGHVYRLNVKSQNSSRMRTTSLPTKVGVGGLPSLAAPLAMHTVLSQTHPQPCIPQPRMPLVIHALPAMHTPFLAMHAPQPCMTPSHASLHHACPLSQPCIPPATCATQSCTPDTHALSPYHASPRPVNRMKHVSETITFLQLRLRTVIICQQRTGNEQQISNNI